MRAALALAAILSTVSGCTLVGATIGGGFAAAANTTSKSKESDLPVGRSMLIGAGLGLIVDALVISAALDGLRGLEGPEYCGGCAYVGGD